MKFVSYMKTRPQHALSSFDVYWVFRLRLGTANILYSFILNSRKKELMGEK